MDKLGAHAWSTLTVISRNISGYIVNETFVKWKLEHDDERWIHFSCHRWSSYDVNYAKIFEWE